MADFIIGRRQIGISPDEDTDTVAFLDLTQCVSFLVEEVERNIGVCRDDDLTRPFAQAFFFKLTQNGHAGRFRRPHETRALADRTGLCVSFVQAGTQPLA